MTDAARPAVTFLDEVTDAYCGQTNHVLSALVDKDRVGALQYTVFRGVPSISMIDVPASCRRQGFGQALVKELQRQFPETEIEWGMLTQEGDALRRSLTFIPVPTEYASSFDALAATRETLKLLSEKQRAGTITAAEIAGWNDHHDKESELEHLLIGKSAVKYLVDTGAAKMRASHIQGLCRDRLQQLDESLAAAEKPPSGWLHTLE